MATDVDYSKFFGDDDAEIDAVVRPRGRRKPRSAEDAARSAKMVEASIGLGGVGSEDSPASVSGGGQVPDGTDGGSGADGGPTAGSGDGGSVSGGDATPDDLTSFYDAEEERKETAELVEATGTEPLPGGRRKVVRDKAILNEIRHEEDSIDLVGDMLMADDDHAPVKPVAEGLPAGPAEPDEDIVLEEEAGEVDGGGAGPLAASASNGEPIADKPAGRSAGKTHSGSPSHEPAGHAPKRPSAGDDDGAAVEVDAEAIARLEEKALDAVEAAEGRGPVEDSGAPGGALPAPSSMGLGGQEEMGENEAKNRKKYVIKATPDYLLTAPGDTGSEPFDIDDVLTDAVDRGASDVHIASMRPIKLRINGTMYKFAKYQIMDPADMNELITNNGRLINKEMVQQLNTQRSVDTAYVIRKGRRHGERFRVHFAEEMNGPAIVFRHIRPEIFKPEEIGLTQDVVDWGLLSQGMILVTGPTGSGKSATLSSILRNVQLTKPGKIITLEEPIETVYPLDGAADIWQREVPENCPTFVRGITDAMREDPDVILVGEIRDYPTIQAAMQACNTGHLTFATIHANSAPDVVTRIMDLAGDADKSELRSNLARNLKGILSQRLLLKPGNDGRIAVREIVQVGRRQKLQIARNDVDAMAADLRARAADLDSQMLMLAIQGKTTLKSARSASMDRAGFDAMVDALSPRVRAMIIDDVTYEPADDDHDLVKLE